MSNLSITLLCNRRCSYCFAMAAAKNSPHKFMSRETFTWALNFLKRSGIIHVKLLGGEPTLHHDFNWFINKSLEEGFKLIVFSNGLMPEQSLDLLKEIDNEKVSVIINTNIPKEQSEKEEEHQKKVFKALGNRITLAFNIHTPNPDLLFLIPIIETYNLNRNIRLGLAHPCLDYPNNYIHPKFYKKVGQYIADIYEQFLYRNIILNFDCGFVPCMFPEGFLEIAHRHPLPAGLHCGPMPDILPDGSIISCYGLATRFSIASDSDITAKDCQEKLWKKLEQYRTIGVYKDCSLCNFREEKKCLGGCMSASLQRVHNF